MAAPRCRSRAALLRRVAAAVKLRMGFQSEAALARDSDEALRQRIYQARRGNALRALIYSLCAQTLSPNCTNSARPRPPPRKVATAARGIGSD